MFKLAILFLLVYLVKVFVVQLLFKPVNAQFALVELSLSLVNIVFRALDLVEMPLDDLDPVVVDLG